MSKPFPTDEPFLRGQYAPLHMECEAPNLPVSGELPKELNGWLYRNGPNPQFAPRGPYHWFSGDGMLHAFQLENGRVSYRNRWVRMRISAIVDARFSLMVDGETASRRTRRGGAQAFRASSSAAPLTGP